MSVRYRQHNRLASVLDFAGDTTKFRSTFRSNFGGVALCAQTFQVKSGCKQLFQIGCLFVFPPENKFVAIVGPSTKRCVGALYRRRRAGYGGKLNSESSKKMSRRILRVRGTCWSIIYSSWTWRSEHAAKWADILPRLTWTDVTISPEHDRFFLNGRFPQKITLDSLSKETTRDLRLRMSDLYATRISHPSKLRKTSFNEPTSPLWVRVRTDRVREVLFEYFPQTRVPVLPIPVGTRVHKERLHAVLVTVVASRVRNFQRFC